MAASTFFRWLHILGGAAWFGEVVTVAFVLVPSLERADHVTRAWMLQTVFPKVFRLASVLVGTVLLAGAGLYLSLHEWRIDFEELFTTRWGLSILIGGGLGLLLGLFHFTAEERLESAVHASGHDPAADEALIRRLKLIPRVGVAVIVVVFLAMMYAARGI